MNNYLCSRGGRWCSVAVLGLQGWALTASADAVCPETPAVAMGFARTEAPSLAESKSGGYRVTGTHWDPILQQKWATLASCGHPEWPRLSLRIDETSTKTASRGLTAEIRDEHVVDALVVRAGDIVHLWRQEDQLRLEVMGVAEESGVLGKVIRVRLLHRSASEQSMEEFTGIIRGPADVEMQP
jgi:hypothetical protein